LLFLMLVIVIELNYKSYTKSIWSWGILLNYYINFYFMSDGVWLNAIEKGFYCRYAITLVMDCVKSKSIWFSILKYVLTLTKIICCFLNFCICGLIIERNIFWYLKLASFIRNLNGLCHRWLRLLLILENWTLCSHF
jgi:hypothetical protein